MFIKPVLYSITACLFWGLIFIVPLPLSNFSPFDIVLGRYFCFGVLSVCFFCAHFLQNKKKNHFRYWKEAILSALVMNIFYFTFLNLGLRYSSPSFIALLVGSAPIVISFLMYLKNKEGKSETLLLTAGAVFLGLIIVNAEGFYNEWENLSLFDFSLGILFGTLALGTWSWYVIFNTEFLKKNQDITASEWTHNIGIMTFLITLVIGSFRMFFLSEEDKILFSNEGISFFIGVFTLGFFCSTVAFTLWNVASKKLSASLSGQIAILETVFGLLFIYIYYNKLPTVFEVIGILLIIGAVYKALQTGEGKKEPVL
ncbi:DMT family transporter [Criblamydia sequanensis]|uniref:Transporter, EamA family n=1 Tax=Candidatus Criblamydia sequanensis CRIB-18 TaxID=1437425 RepID=A0A090D012_9BACT|nr:DMT family transporter [Criblamydia sequanensis]CDR33135.1 Transporter, EamA family [Criblamydia sequanensis CRIB-18]